MKKSWARIKWSIRFQGYTVTALKFPVRMLERVGIPIKSFHWYERSYQNAFDRRFGVNTAEEVPVDRLGIDDELASQAIEYSPSSPIELAMTIESNFVDVPQSSFIDFGSGKGLGLLVAAEFPFDHVIGIEISAALHKLAIDNLERAKKSTRKSRQVVCKHFDARDFQFPTTPLIIYFYNPFGELIMQQVCENLVASLNETPRKCLVIYRNPVLADLILDLGFSECDDKAMPQFDTRVFHFPESSEPVEVLT